MKTQIWSPRQAMLKKDFEIYHFCDNYFKAVELHHHDFYEIYYFIEGKATYTVEGRQYPMQKHNILLISPNELHQVNVPEQQTYERIVLWISKEYLQRLSSEDTHLIDVFTRSALTKNNLITLSKESLSKITDSFDQIINYYNSNDFGNDLLCQAELTKLLVMLNAYALRPNGAATQTNLSDSVIDYVGKNLGDSDLSIDRIAKKFFVSPSRLSHIFKEETGTSLYQYVIKKRLVYSKVLLLENSPVTEVYAKCGFNDYTGFFRTFKQEYGLTPKQFVQLNKK